MQIIIKGKAKYGKTKAEIVENLRQDGIDTHGLYNSEEQEDKGRWLDKKHGLRNLDEQQAEKLKRRK